MAFNAGTLELYILYTHIFPAKSRLLEIDFLIYFSVSDLLLHLTKA